MFLLKGTGGGWNGLPRGFLLVGGGYFCFTLSKILLATKIRQSGARKLAKLESACLV